MKISATIWGIVGVITGILDALDMLQMGAISMSGVACKTAECTTNYIGTMVAFMVDVVTGPLLLAASLISNPVLGIFGIIAGIAIIIVFYGENK